METVAGTMDRVLPELYVAAFTQELLKQAGLLATQDLLWKAGAPATPDPLKQAGLTTTIKHLLGLSSPARSRLRGDPFSNPDLARDLAGTFGTTPGASRDGRGVVRLGGQRPGGQRSRQRPVGGASSMLIGRPGSRFYRGSAAKLSTSATC